MGYCTIADRHME